MKKLILLLLFFIVLTPLVFATDWNISTVVYDNVSISTIKVTLLNSATGISFKPDGTKLYETSYKIGNGQVTGKIFQFTCSIPWDLSSCSYDDISILTQSSHPDNLIFKPDGTKLYEIGNKKIYQYTCSIPWDLSSCSYSNISILTQNKYGEDIFFKPDGTKLYELNSYGDRIYQYTCSIPWDLSSCSYDDISISSRYNQSDHIKPLALIFEPDGTKLYTSNYYQKYLYKFTCSIPWDLSSCSYDNITINISPKNESTWSIIPTSLFFKPDGTKLYVLNHRDGKIYQYTISHNITPNKSYIWCLIGVLFLFLMIILTAFLISRPKKRKRRKKKRRRK